MRLQFVGQGSCGCEETAMAGPGVQGLGLRMFQDVRLKPATNPSSAPTYFRCVWDESFGHPKPYSLWVGYCPNTQTVYNGATIKGLI